jgi:hypothetical protein
MAAESDTTESKRILHTSDSQIMRNQEMGASRAQLHPPTSGPLSRPRARSGDFVLALVARIRTSLYLFDQNLLWHCAPRCTFTATAIDLRYACTLSAEGHRFGPIVAKSDELANEIPRCTSLGMADSASL